jgi:hypothetical protein
MVKILQETEKRLLEEETKILQQLAALARAQSVDPT